MEVTATDPQGAVSEAATFLVTTTSPVAVEIPDAHLRAAVEQELGKQTGETITSAEMEHMANLACKRREIQDLAGLEFATALTDLALTGNAVTDLTPLSALTGIRTINLAVNAISDATPLSGLANLATLNLGRNALSDVSPLAGLAELTSLDLARNEITDITSLFGPCESNVPERLLQRDHGCCVTLGTRQDDNAVPSQQRCLGLGAANGPYQADVLGHLLQ